MHRKPEVLEAWKMVRLPCKDYLPIHFCEKWHPPDAFSASPKMDADMVKSALMHTARLMNILATGLQRMVTKVQCVC